MILLKEPAKEVEDLSTIISNEYSHYTISEEMALHLAEVILDAGYQKTTDYEKMTVFDEQDNEEKPR